MKRNTGSAPCGLIPAIITRERSRCSIANEITLGLNSPNDIRHFCAINRNRLCSFLSNDKYSCGSTTYFWLATGIKGGVHNADSRATAPSTEEVISDFHDISRYLIRNSLTREDKSCCCTASSAGSSTQAGCSSISTSESPSIWNRMKPRFLIAKPGAS